MPQPRKSDFMHQLSGSRSQATEPNVTIKPGKPKCPKGLCRASQLVFRRICKLLEARQNLTEGDVELITLYAIQHDRWTRALEHVKTEGEICTYVRLDSNGKAHDQLKPNLWLKVVQDTERQLVALTDRLGLTPMNRSKVKPTGEQEKPAPVQTPEEAFFAGLDNRQRSGWIAPPVVEEAL
jgi:P27 family predicted phage terminase small subunit